MSHPIIIESAGGEYMEEVLVVEWRAKPGDAVKKGEVVVVVETAKAATEIEAPADGVLTDILYPVGKEAPVGATLGIVGDGVVGVARADATGAPVDNSLIAAAEGAVLPPETSLQAPAVRPAGARVVASPLARRRAREAGIDLSGLTPSAASGRIKRRDVEAVLARAAETPLPAARPAPSVPAGALPPIVFLHGFGADRSIWRQVTALIGRDQPVLALDLPGHGDALSMPAASVTEMALALSDVLEEKRIDSAHLVGHSLGGAVALALTALGRVSVRSLCLIAPAGLGPEIDHGFVAGLSKAGSEAALAPWLARMVGDPAVLPPGYAAAVLRQWRKTGAQEKLAGLALQLFPDGVQAEGVGAALAALRVPAKVIWGRRDAIIPPAHAEAVPGSVALHRLAGIGHVPQIECPEIVASLVGELVRSAR
ncbi:acetoin dehydrogenase dihydrolipoyllysine-residue acetyltransferase subunit [Ensifer soli]|uniref:acetoin dehydrogenase dihydrolipoyllysine-residue acetyltransferase subunit n=1 Tax=Ciceribacter sp. sgz301302 TaxID=3342379 RepID=UPI0035B6CE5D